RRAEPLAQFVVDRRVDKDPLHADAALSGLVIRTADQALDDRVKAAARVRVDDARGIAAQFQHHLLAAGPRLELPADLTAREAEERDPLVLDQCRGILVGAGQDRERARRQVGLCQYLA